VKVAALAKIDVSSSIPDQLTMTCWNTPTNTRPACTQTTTTTTKPFVSSI